MTLAALLSVAAFAQPPAVSGERAAQARDRIEQLQERLNLTPGQIDKLRPILKAQAEEMRAVREKHGEGGSRRDRMKMGREMKSVADKYDDSIAAVLTKDQMKEWKKIQEERKEQIKQKRRG